MAVAGRSGVALAQAEAADEGLPFLVECEFQAHAFRVVLAAGEAIVLLQLHVLGFVSVDLTGHSKILADARFSVSRQLDEPDHTAVGTSHFLGKSSEFGYTTSACDLAPKETMNPAMQSVVVAFGLFVGMLLFLDMGYRVGRRARREASWHEGIGALEAAVYALLGLLLGFSFSGATSRFDAQRHLSVKEANAIGTAYLRLDDLPPDTQPEMRRLFRDYLNARLELQASLSDLSATEREMAKTSQLQQQIWSRAVLSSRGDTTQNSARLLLPAINEMIDVAAERGVAFHARLPVLIFLLLIFIALMSALLAGYGMAKRAKRSLLHMFRYAACISATIYAVTDLEHPRSGLIRVDLADRAMLELRDVIR